MLDFSFLTEGNWAPIVVGLGIGLLIRFLLSSSDDDTKED